MPLAAEDLTHPPAISKRSNKIDRLRKIPLCHLHVIDGGRAAGEQCTAKQCWIAQLAGDVESFFGVRCAAAADPSVEDSLIGECPRTDGGISRAILGECGLQPRSSFLDPAAHEPQGL